MKKYYTIRNATVLATMLLVSGFVFHCFSADTLVSPDQVPPLQALQEESPQPYPLCAGDAIRIVGFPDSTAIPSGFYPIDGDGNISLPGIGMTKVVGLSDAALKQKLAASYIDYLKYPTIQIYHYIRLCAIGGFRRPGMYWISPSASLWQAIQATEGPIRQDGLKLMSWERNRTIVKDNIIPDIESGQCLKNIGFKSGDQLYVTNKAETDVWTVFRTEIFPMLSIAVSAATTTFTLYEIYKGTR